MTLRAGARRLALAAVAVAVAATAGAVGVEHAAAQAPTTGSATPAPPVGSAPAADRGASNGMPGAPAEAAGPIPWPSAPPDARRGLALFEAHCAGCHGPFGRGDGALAGRLPAPPPDLAAGARAAASPADDFRTITAGRLERLMPPFGASLSDAERWDLVAAVRLLRDTPHALVRGRAAWEGRCAACHGPAPAEGEAPFASATGGAVPPDLERFDLLGAWSDDALVRALADGAAGEAHRDALQGLPPSGTADLASFARSLALAPLPADGLVAGGEVRGRVVNRTPGGRAPEDGRIVLRAADGLVPEPPLTATLAADGRFVLSGVVGGAAVYRAHVEAFGARFAPPEPIAAAAPATGSEAVVDLWDVDDGLVPRAPLLHAVAAPVADRGVLEVVERWVLAVDGDRAAWGVRLALPAAARNVRLADDLAAGAGAEAGEVVLPLALPPGEHEVIVVYDVPYAARSAVLDRPLLQDVGDASLTVVDPGARAASPAIVASEPVTIGQASGVRYGFGSQPAGTRLVATLEGLPPSAAGAQDVVAERPPSPVSPGALTAAALAACALGLAAVAGFALREPGARGARRARARAALRAEAVGLERSREAGDLAPRDYAARRARLVERALRLDAAAPGASSPHEPPPPPTAPDEPGGAP